MNKLQLTPLALLVFAASVGCTAETGADQAEAGSADKELASHEAPSTASERTLNSFSAGEQKVAFVVDVDNPSEVALVEEGSAFTAAFLSDKLVEQHGALTMLEIFYALAPEGEEPDPALLDMHHEEAFALGREDDAVRRVSFDVNQPVEKSSTSCNNYVYDDSYFSNDCAYWVHDGARDNLTGFNTIYVGDSPGHYTTSAVRAGVCNDSSSSMSTRWIKGDSNVNNGNWQYGSWSTLNANTLRRYTVGYTSSTKRFGAQGSKSGSNPYRMRQGYSGWSLSIHCTPH